MPRRLSGGGDIYEARRVKTLMRGRAAGGTGMAAIPQPVAQNDMLLANSLLFWSLLAGPTAEYDILIAGADPYVPAWGALTVAAISDLAYATPALTFGVTNAEGVADSIIRSDATLALFDATVPDIIQCDDAAAAGSAGVAARRDHTHGIVCAAPAANLSVSTTNAEGSATSFARSDHSHAITSSSNPGAAASILATDASGYLQLVGLGIGAAPGSADLHFATGRGITHADSVVAGRFLRANGTRYVPDTLDVADLTDLAYATPALSFGTANAAGAANNVIRSDATLAIFDATVPTTIQCDAGAGAGVAGVAARRDHLHAIVCATAGTIQPDDSAAEGTATSFARSDHGHAIVCAVAGAIQPDDSAAEGTATSFARSDHRHSIVGAAPAANLTVSTTNAEGSATSFARSDHGHAITSSSNPGAAAAILATNASGYLQLVGLGIGAAPGSADLHFATGRGITHADGVTAGWFLRANGTRYIPDTLDIADITDLAYATPALVFGTANAAGAANSVIRSNATLAIFDTTNPTSVDVGDAAVVGTAAFAARRDHQHAVTSSSNPGAAASILATDASGRIQLVGLGIGAAALNNAVVMVDNGWIGLAAAGGRFLFDSTPAPDTITVFDASLVVDTDTGNDPFWVTRLGTTDQAASFYIDDATFYIQSIQDEAAGAYGSIYLRCGSQVGQAPNFVISDYRSGADVEIVHIDIDTGDVGVGTATPAAQVDVTGSLGSILLSPNGWGAYITFTRDGANYIQASGAAGSVNLGGGGGTADLQVLANHNVVVNSNLGIGTATIPHGGAGAAKLATDGADASTAGPHVQFTTAADDYPLFQQLNWRHDDIYLAFDAYYDGAWKSSDAGSNFKIHKYGDELIFGYDSGVAQGGAVTWVSGMTMDTGGDVTIGNPPTLSGYRLIVYDSNTGGVAAYVVNDGNDAGCDVLGLTGGADDGSGVTSYIVARDGDGDHVGGLRNNSGNFEVYDISDEATKHNVQPTGWGGLDVIRQLRVRDYNRVKNPNGPRLTGFVAQEVQGIVPGLVAETRDGLLTTATGALIPFLVLAIQEQQAIIERMELRQRGELT